MTLKAGAKAWKTDEGWGSFFMLLCASIMATLPLIKYWQNGVNALQQRALEKAMAAQVAATAASKAGNEDTSSEEDLDGKRN